MKQRLLTQTFVKKIPKNIATDLNRLPNMFKVEAMHESNASQQFAYLSGFIEAKA
jgi:hypothetical protein